ncbi:MAG: cytochrome D1 domain-containing protein [Rhodospirillaceae bacterium]
MIFRRAAASLGQVAASLGLVAVWVGVSITPARADSCPPLRGTGDLGIVIERSAGRVTVVEHSRNTVVGRVDGLGDLSHAAAVFSRDGRYAYVFGRDGGLSKVDLLGLRLERRIVQAGNSIGGAISADGRLVAAQNYEPGGVRVFDADTLEPVADLPADSKVVGLVDAPGNKFVFSLFDAGEIRVADMTDPARPKIERFPNIGLQPYDGLITPDGRYYLAGLFGEDGLALLDLWHTEAGVRRVLGGYGRGGAALPVYKMPHLRGWALAAGRAWLPAIGHHFVLAADVGTWTETARIPVLGQPVFVIARPDGRQLWVTFAIPDNDRVQVIDVATATVIRTIETGPAALHLEFTPRGDAVWIPVRDRDRVQIYDTATFALRAELPAEKPSGIFFSARAGRIGF